MDAFDREEEAILEACRNGEISDKECRRQIRDLYREAIDMDQF